MQIDTLAEANTYRWKSNKEIWHRLAKGKLPCAIPLLLSRAYEFICLAVRLTAFFTVLYFLP